MDKTKDKIEAMLDLALRLVPEWANRIDDDDPLFGTLPPVLQLMILHRQADAKVKAALDKLFQDKETNERYTR
jgi:hypothetical protein